MTIIQNSFFKTQVPRTSHNTAEKDNVTNINQSIAFSKENIQVVISSVHGALKGIESILKTNISDDFLKWSMNNKGYIKDSMTDFFENNKNIYNSFFDKNMKLTDKFYNQSGIDEVMNTPGYLLFEINDLSNLASLLTKKSSTRYQAISTNINSYGSIERFIPSIIKLLVWVINYYFDKIPNKKLLENIKQHINIMERTNIFNDNIGNNWKPEKNWHNNVMVALIYAFSIRYAFLTKVNTFEFFQNFRDFTALILSISVDEFDEMYLFFSSTKKIFSGIDDKQLEHNKKIITQIYSGVNNAHVINRKAFLDVSIKTDN